MEEDQNDPEPNPSQAVKAPTLNTGEMIKLLEERLSMYQTAEKNANQANDSTRARRY